MRERERIKMNICAKIFGVAHVYCGQMTMKGEENVTFMVQMPAYHSNPMVQKANETLSVLIVVPLSGTRPLHITRRHTTSCTPAN